MDKKDRDALRSLMMEVDRDWLSGMGGGLRFREYQLRRVQKFIEGIIQRERGKEPSATGNEGEDSTNE